MNEEKRKYTRPIRDCLYDHKVRISLVAHGLSWHPLAQKKVWEGQE